MHKLLCLCLFFVCLLFDVIKAAHNSPCLPQHCSSRHCVIHNQSGSLSGTCHGISYTRYKDCGSKEVNYHLSDGQSCQCPDSACVDRMTQVNTHLHTSFRCLSHTCHGNAFCHIYQHKDSSQIESQCVSSKPNDGIQCVDHSTVENDGGCYCNTDRCVQKTALYALGTTCSTEEEVEFSMTSSGHYHARCVSVDHVKQKCDIFTIVSLFDNALTFLPCACNSQDCIHSMLDRINEALITTVPPSTSTVVQTTTASQAPTTATAQPLAIFPSCVHGHCDIQLPYCHLYLFESKPDGSCKPFKAGPVCADGSYIQGGGCHCLTTNCVVDTIQDFYNQQVTTGNLTTELPSTSPVPTTTVQPGMMCDGKRCDIHYPYCHLFQYKGVAAGRCMPFHVWQPCKTYLDLEHQGCECTDTYCINKMLTDFLAHSHTNTTTTVAMTTPAAVSNVSMTTASVPTVATAVTNVSMTKTTVPTVSTAFTNVSMTATTVPTVSISVSNVSMTTATVPHVSTTAALTTAAMTIKPTNSATATSMPWKCVNLICQPNEACRLSFGLGGIKAACEAGTTGPECTDHQSITQTGCLCRSEICVVKTALHCFGNICPADKTCKISRSVDWSFSGNCSELDFSHLSFCSKSPANQVVQCDCWTQSCIDPYQTFTPQVHQTTTNNPTTGASVTQLVHTVRSCIKCGDLKSSIPCSMQDILHNTPTLCNNGEEYCMTDVYHSASGTVDVIKRCVDRATCERQWITQTADLDYCKNYGVINNPSDFQCHFCCTSDGCNTDIMPNSTTLFRKV